jgi:hypothetical protein
MQKELDRLKYNHPGQKQIMKSPVRDSRPPQRLVLHEEKNKKSYADHRVEVQFCGRAEVSITIRVVEERGEDETEAIPVPLAVPCPCCRGIMDHDIAERFEGICSICQDDKEQMCVLACVTGCKEHAVCEAMCYDEMKNGNK